MSDALDAYLHDDLAGTLERKSSGSLGILKPARRRGSPRPAPAPAGSRA
jgi:hypothetical protein